MFPIQDTPSVKFTYDAEIITPENNFVKMSAASTSNSKFDQRVKVPAYLIALVIAPSDMVSHQKDGQMALTQTEEEQGKAVYLESSGSGPIFKYIKAMEEYLGVTYQWGNSFNVFVMPSGLDGGKGLQQSEIQQGMENPLLTIVENKVMSDGKLDASVLLHEMAHSWFGNLVTCATWSDFWLNEAFAVFAERKISRKILGAQKADRDTKQGIKEMNKDI